MTTSPRSPRLLLAFTVLLTVAGLALLTAPHMPHAPAAAPPPRASAPTAVATTTAPGGRTAQTDASAAATAAPTPAHAAGVSVPPPHGEGTAADTAVQQSLQDAWPADLPDGDEHTLLAAGRALLRADATGAGRAQWPALFGDRGQAIAPAFATTGFRIQAAIARRDASPNRAVVHLIWAGTDRGGTYTDRRITDWHFTRTTSAKGTSTWTPQPHT